MRQPVSGVLTGVAAGGVATATYSVLAHQPWTLERLAASGDSGTTAPELRVYRNGTLIDSTGGANSDTSESNGVELMPGDQIRADWSNCSTGAVMRLVIEGTAG